jgi:hypothetical protein
VTTKEELIAQARKFAHQYYEDNAEHLIEQAYELGKSEPRRRRTRAGKAVTPEVETPGEGSSTEGEQP